MLIIDIECNRLTERVINKLPTDVYSPPRVNRRQQALSNTLVDTIMLIPSFVSTISNTWTYNSHTQKSQKTQMLVHASNDTIIVFRNFSVVRMMYK